MATTYKSAKAKQLAKELEQTPEWIARNQLKKSEKFTPNADLAGLFPEGLSPESIGRYMLSAGYDKKTKKIKGKLVRGWMVEMS